LDTLYQTYPYLAAFLTCSVKASTADFLAQSQTKATTNEHSSRSDSREHLDICRNLAFILYGGFYQGMGQTFLYTQLYPTLFGSVPTLTSVLAQASLDNFLLAPFFCLPTVYTMKSLLAGRTPQQGLEKYWDHIFSQSVLLRYWSIWFPVQCLNFAVVPEHLRVPCGAVVSFFWICLLSSISSNENSETQQSQAQLDTESASESTTQMPPSPLQPLPSRL
jgi:protein Mpv17